MFNFLLILLFLAEYILNFGVFNTCFFRKSGLTLQHDRSPNYFFNDRCYQNIKYR